MNVDIKRCELTKFIFIIAMLFNIGSVRAQVSDTFSVNIEWKGIEKYNR